MNYVIYDNSNFFSGIENYVLTISQYLNIPIKKFNENSYFSKVFIPKIKKDKNTKIIFSNPLSPIEFYLHQFIFIHDLYFLNGVYTSNDSLFNILSNKIIAHEKLPFLHNHTLIPISYYTKTQLEKMDYKTTNPVYPLLKTPEKINLLPPFPKKPDKIYILHISDMNIRKNIPFIQELFKHLDKEKFILLRIGQKIPGIENQLSFINVSPSIKNNIIQHSDFCISASIDEGFNLPIAECILNNIPVISTDIPVIREIYDNTIITIKSNAKIKGKNIINDFKEIDKWIDIIENEKWKYNIAPAKKLLSDKIEKSKINLKKILDIQ